MAIGRKLPGSDVTRNKALAKAKAKNDGMPVAHRFLTPTTSARLNTIQPLFKTATQNRGNSLAAQVDATIGVAQSFYSAKKWVSHFFQVFNLGIVRKKYLQQHRPYYQLDASSDKLPPLGTYQDVALWGERIETGDAARIAAGGAPMENPSAIEVKAVVDDFITKNNDQSARKDSYDQQQEAVAALHDEVDKVIKKVWDEVATFYNEEENSSRRRKCREWGVVYVSNVEHTFYLRALDAQTNAGIDLAEIVLLETGNTNGTSNGGGAVIKSSIVDEATFRFTHPDYQSKEIVVSLPAGVTTFEVTVLLEAL